MFGASLLLITALWEGYKAIGPEAGGKILGARLLPKAENRSMPHVWDMLSRYGRPEQRGSSRTIFETVLAGSWYTMRIALAGLAVGLVAGMLLAILMARFKVVERGLLPWLIVSQTVPLIALAPLVVSWGGKVEFFRDRRWMAAAIIAAFLAFFPVAVGGLKGLTSPPSAAVELMNSYAAPWWKGLLKLRLPAAVPYLLPALKLAAAAALVGTIVAEISTGLAGGIGRLIIEYSREATSDPAKVFTAVFAAAAIGLVLSGLVSFIDVFVSRNRPKERLAS